MAAYYLDSSALAKRYVAEIGSGWVTNLCQSIHGHTLNIARITGAEIVAALFRRTHIGSLTLSQAQTAAARFRSDMLSQYEIVEVTESVINTAMRLAETHKLRGYDSVQLAGALEVQILRAAFVLTPLTFVSADKQLNVIASLEGLAVENPNDHP